MNPPPEQSRRPLVLVVDDEYQVLKAAWRLIHGLGYSVILAQDGEEGLRMAREYAPQLILSDALMPKLDERELCRLLKLDPNTASVKTVIMTAFTGAGKYKTTHLKEYHFDDYLQKPIEFEKLRAVLQKHLK